MGVGERTRLASNTPASTAVAPVAPMATGPGSVTLAAAGRSTLAAWWQRVLAWMIDVLVVWGPVLIVGAAAGAFGRSSSGILGQNPGVHSTSSAVTAVFAVGAVLFAGYFVILNGWFTGQTLGNVALGIAVRDASTGRAIGLPRSLVRLLVRTGLYLLFLIPGLVNDLYPLWDARRQTLADKAAGSVVVRS